METATTSSQQRSKTSNVWLTGSDSHKEFVALCQNKGWETRKYLPRRGSREAKELDKLMDRGLGPQKPLSRDQVNRKFAQWKRLVTTEPMECRLLDSTKIETADALLRRLQKSECWLHFICKQKVDMFRSNSPVYSVVLAEGTWLCTCIDHMRGSLIGLVNASIERNKAKRARGTEIDSQVQSTYLKDERELREKFVDNFTTHFCRQPLVATLLNQQNKRNVQERARAVATDIGGEVVSLIVLAVKRGGQGEETMQAAVDEAIKIHQQSDASQSCTDSIWNRTVYNLGGWLLNASHKVTKRRREGGLLKGALQKIVRGADASHKAEELKAQGLPTGKTDAMASRFPRSLHYPSKEFFDFILLMEAVCERLLVVRSLKIFGSKVADELTSVLQNTLPVQVAIKRCAGPEQTISTAELQAASEYLAGTYMKMRATDFLRQIMAHRRKSLNPGTRPRLAAIVLGGGSSGKTEEKTGAVTNKFTCFFCKQAGHTVRRCDKMKIAPSAGEPHSMETTIVLDGEVNTYTWYFCSLCQQWSRHSTDHHNDEGVCHEIIDDSTQEQAIDDNSELFTDEAVTEEITEFATLVDEVNSSLNTTPEDLM